MGELENIYISFFENIFGTEISMPVEISTKKPTNESFQNGRKSLPDTKKSDFSAVSQSIRLISWKSG